MLFYLKVASLLCVAGGIYIGETVCDKPNCSVSSNKCYCCVGWSDYMKPHIYPGPTYERSLTTDLKTEENSAHGTHPCKYWQSHQYEDL